MGTTNMLDTASDVLAVVNAGAGCACDLLPYITEQDDSAKAVEIFTAMVEASIHAAEGPDRDRYLGHAIRVILATGYQTGAADALDTLESPVTVPDDTRGL